MHKSLDTYGCHKDCSPALINADRNWDCKCRPECRCWLWHGDFVFCVPILSLSKATRIVLEVVRGQKSTMEMAVIARKAAGEVFK